MSAFDPIQIAYSYTGFQEAQGGNVFPGVQLDVDIAEISDKTNAAFAILGGIVRLDGKLANGVVTRRSLAEDILLGFSAPRPWAASTAYLVDDSVSYLNAIYLATAAHTSGGAFATDLAAGLWELLVEFAVDASIADGAVTAPKLASNAVTTAKILDASVTTPKIADEAITAAKLAPSLGAVPVGASMDFDGVIPPARWLLKYGQAVSRTTYAALLAVIAPTFTFAVTNGSSIIVSATDLSALGLVGAVVEGPGIPPGTTVLSMAGTSFLLSAAATISTNPATVRLLPYGAGDGATTFNIADERDRVTVGRGDMGGTTAGRLDSAILNTRKLSDAGGADRVTLDTGQLPAHTHTGTTVAAGAHNHTVTTSNTFGQKPNGSGANAMTGTLATFNTSTASDHTHTFTSDATGGAQSHPNVQPSRVVNRIIFAGV